VVVNFGYITGKTLTFSVYTEAGVERESGSTMTETPVGSGLYLGSAAVLQEYDNVIIKEGTTVVGHGEYRKEQLSWIKNG